MKPLGQIGESMHGKELVKEPQPTVSKHVLGSVMVWRVFDKVEDLCQVKGKLNQTGYHNIWNMAGG